jgi:hypothetical protein
MTLNITVLTPDVIYQSADFRLTNADTCTLVTDASRKLISLQYSGWDGLITYTGLGRWRDRDVSQWVVDWVAGIDDATPDWMANSIAVRGSELLSEVLARTGMRFRHTFVLAAFVGGRVRAYLISNFENGRSRPRAAADSRLQVTPLVLSTHRRSRVVVTGASPAVTRVQRRQLERIAAAHPGDGGRIRRSIERINATASRIPQAGGLVSPECVVVSFRSDGAGFINSSAGDGPRLQQISNGVDVNRFMADALKTVGIDLEKLQLVGGVFGASNRARAPGTVMTCAPQVVTPDGSEAYALTEIASRDFQPRSAQGLNNRGDVVGTGGQTGGSTSIPWLWSAGRLLRLASEGSAVAVNDEGLVAGAVSNSMALFRDETVQPLGKINERLGTFEITGSVANAINELGVVAATLQGQVVDPGHANTRAAVYTASGEMRTGYPTSTHFASNSNGSEPGRLLRRVASSSALPLLVRRS